MLNKFKFQNSKERIILHKVKKHWVFISSCFIALFGLGISNNGVVAHADNNKNSTVTSLNGANVVKDNKTIDKFSSKDTADSKYASDNGITTHQVSANNSNVITKTKADAGNNTVNQNQQQFTAAKVYANARESVNLNPNEPSNNQNSQSKQLLSSKVENTQQPQVTQPQTVDKTATLSEQPAKDNDKADMYNSALLNSRLYGTIHAFVTYKMKNDGTQLKTRVVPAVTKPDGSDFYVQRWENDGNGNSPITGISRLVEVRRVNGIVDHAVIDPSDFSKYVHIDTNSSDVHVSDGTNNYPTTLLEIGVGPLGYDNDGQFINFNHERDFLGWAFDTISNDKYDGTTLKYSSGSASDLTKTTTVGDSAVFGTVQDAKNITVYSVDSNGKHIAHRQYVIGNDVQPNSTDWKLNTPIKITVDGQNYKLDKVTSEDNSEYYRDISPFNNKSFILSAGSTQSTSQPSTYNVDTSNGNTSVSFGSRIPLKVYLHYVLDTPTTDNSGTNTKPNDSGNNNQQPSETVNKPDNTPTQNPDDNDYETFNNFNVPSSNVDDNVNKVTPSQENQNAVKTSKYVYINIHADALKNRKYLKQLNKYGIKSFTPVIRVIKQSSLGHGNVLIIGEINGKLVSLKMSSKDIYPTYYQKLNKGNNHVRVLRDIYSHKDISLSDDSRISKHSKGAVLPVYKLSMNNEDGRTTFVLDNGNYITADKYFVLLINK
ncbi:DUF5776 domain-containing protein [Apilactobacillus xinyiensis]|uniref:DUF5776 domain-containing protein n=1 Tax=Apilactobacillus xinyiensis TaxID=2841032 RepID=UPI0033650729